MTTLIGNLDNITDNDLKRLGKAFMEESGIDSTFDPDYFRKFWSVALQMGVATFIVSYNDQKYVTGMLGLLLSQCPFSGDVVAIETFWFVDKEYRGGLTGVRLFKDAIAWAKEVQAKRITFSSIVQTTSEKLETFYESQGFRKLETQYVKELD